VILLPAFGGPILKMIFIFKMPFGQKFNLQEVQTVGKSLTRGIVGTGQKFHLGFLNPFYPEDIVRA